MSSRSFLVASLGFSMYSIMLSANLDSFTCFPVWILLFFFPPLIAMAMNNNGKSRHSYLIPDLRGNAFRFSLLRILSATGFSYMDFIQAPCMLTFWGVFFIINWCWVVSKTFPAYIEMIVYVLFFSLLIWCITLTDLSILKNPCMPGINPSWSRYMIHILLDLVC